MANLNIKIGNYCVSESSRPYLIAEIGINHNGDIKIAKRLIDAAFACEWDCVKFQKRTPDKAVPESQKQIMRDTPWGSMPYIEYKKHIEFEKKEYDEIDAYCDIKPLDWSASPWDIESLEFLLQYDVPFIKIPSAMNTNEELIKKACQSGKPIILSEGMSLLEEMDTTIEWLERYSNGDYIICHTNSSYPCPNNELNLRLIQTMKDRYHCLVGYSGHESNLEPSVIAAVLGACVIERHVTLDHNMWGSDQKASLEVQAMAMLKKRISSSLEALGDGKKKLYESEMKKRMELRGRK
ncbi:N-acetylneuraminate synthase family protein [Butyrivibrio sp. TB]|uniref:N-acetylneuraminate synthase family protein n=1 Tax=Butyrivibrio sp. TB TaxID=1520809 RepID=UPI0008D6687C|nr:N-acetylneuraminate synthase family protein [Butyrivibrio sp. TB]SEP58367.1 N-acetylneuraminate synthase [Butyrivibrio sp. TB]